MKERWFRMGAAAVMIAAFSAGCDKTSKEDSQGLASSPSPAATRTLEEQPSLYAIEKMGWSRLSPLERIDRLEIKAYPHIPNFDVREELKTATAQFYCEATKCNLAPEEMAHNVFFVSPSRFIEETEKDSGRKYTKEERERTLKTRPEMVNRDNESFINIELHNKLTDLVEQNNPDIVRMLGQRDFSTVVDKSIFLHIFSHMNQKDTSYYFDPFSLRIVLGNDPINIPKIDRLEGFTFVGESEDKRPFYINGANEAVTELTSIIVGIKTGFYLSLSDKYNDGAMLVDMLNKRSGITNEEFLEYANGTQPISELLRKWGSLKDPSNPDEKAAIMAIATIGIYVDGAIKSLDDAKSAVESWLRPSS